MPSKKALVKELKKLSTQFITRDQRKELLDSLKKDRTKWLVWSAALKNVFKRLNKKDAVQVSGLILVLEQKPESKLCQNQLKKFLIDKTEHYKYYDFGLEKKLKEKSKTTKNLWTSKVLRLFISRSFLGIIIVGLILGFILWFYLDRESCLEFVQKVVEPFLKAVK